MIVNKLKKDLYICLTPLQVVIAKKIIVSESCSRIKPDFILFPLVDTERFRYYFNSMSALCDESIYWASARKFPFYVMDIARIFFRKEYNCVYLSSIDSVHIHCILSFIKFNEINTFDDGAVNIAIDSIYHKDEPSFFEFLKRVVRRASFNKFSSGKIKKLSLRHYTLYPGVENIIENTVPIDLFSRKVHKINGKKEKKCTVLLGAVYREVLTSSKDEDQLLFLVRGMIAAQDKYSIHYFPHPRDEIDYFENVIRHDDIVICEEVISDLLQKYEEIDLLGFASSVQFNLMGINNINIIFIESVLLKDVFVNLGKKLVKSNAKVLKLDNFHTS